MAEEHGSSCKRSHRFVHDWDGTIPLSVRIPAILEDVTLRDRAPLEPLYHRIDPDGLDSLFTAPRRDIDRNAGVVMFPFGDYWTAIYADGAIVITTKV